MGVGLMAEPKKSKGKPGRKPDPSRVMQATTMVRSSAAWREWVVALAEFKRTTMSDLIDDALVAYARREGFDKPPPPRGDR